jgi:hypothetical protein
MQLNKVGITMKKVLCNGWAKSTTTKPLTQKRNEPMQMHCPYYRYKMLARTKEATSRYCTKHIKCEKKMVLKPLTPNENENSARLWRIRFQQAASYRPD